MPVRKQLPRENDKNALSSAGFPPLPDERFDILYADPPWDYKGQSQHNGAGGRDTGSALRHYPTATLAEMSRWPITDIAEQNALLFMWSSSPHLDQAMDLGKAWDFQWVTVAFVWDKKKVNPGFYTMSQCELCLLFKRGKIPSPRGSRNERQLVSATRRRHSEKPKAVRTRISRMFPNQKKIELFARQKTPGWAAWGLEAEENMSPSSKKTGGIVVATPFYPASPRITSTGRGSF